MVLLSGLVISSTTLGEDSVTAFLISPGLMFGDILVDG
jgi:hypothetical protein